MIAGIYAILNILNGKYYIGSAVDFKDRWRLHLLAFTHNKHHNRHLQRAWTTYGSGAFIFVVLECCDSNLETREQFWIDQLNSTNHELGYNICAAGRNRFGVKASEETRKKLSESHKGHVHSQETLAKMSIAHKGNKGPLGRKQSQEEIEQRRLNNIGKKRSDEAKMRMSAAQKGKIISSETKAKMSAAAKARWKPLDYTCDMWV